MTSMFIDGEPAVCLSAYDRGFLYGHGLFETMCLWNDQLPLLDFHLNRLQAGARVLSIPCDLFHQKTLINQALSNFPAQGLVKLILTAGDGSRGYRYNPDTSQVRQRCLIQYFELASARGDIELSVSEYRLPHNPYLAGIKHLNRLDQVLAATGLPSNCEGLLLDQAGNIIEAISSNIFVRCHQQWLTPSLLKSGVAGVMRQLLLERIMPAIGLKPICQDISIEMLQSADEVFICNAVNGVTSVRQISGLDHQVFASGKIVFQPPVQTALIKAELHRQQPCFSE